MKIRDCGLHRRLFSLLYDLSSSLNSLSAYVASAGLRQGLLYLDGTVLCRKCLILYTQLEIYTPLAHVVNLDLLILIFNCGEP